VPPKCTFAEADREPLILPTHSRQQVIELLDEKVGQLIAMRRREVAAPERNRLTFALSRDLNDSAAAPKLCEDYQGQSRQRQPRLNLLQ
jgi:hypothetical protein